jgi:hypothetical protein
MVRRLTCGAIAAVLLVAVPPAIFIGVNCYPGGQARPSADAAPPPVDIPGYQRAEAFTYLTLPEWFIVYSADEYARVLERGAPSDFPYLGSIGQYWGYYSSACAVTRSRYPFETGYHVMLGIIGASFTVEYLLKGLYENTVGRATGWFGRDTPEDRFAAKTAAEYGAFMHMVPWYEFTFGAHLRRLWTEVPLFGARPIRKLERRLALTLEYSIKGVYGWLIGLATRSAYSAEDLKIYSRVENASDAIFADPKVERVRQLGDGAYIVRLPRYEAFTRTALGLVDARVRFRDVAGNDEMLMTAVVPASFDERALAAGDVMASRPILSDPQHKRLALRVPVVRLNEIVSSLRATGGTIEHLYDY